MRGKGRAAARSKRASADVLRDTTHLPSLPVDLLQQVLGMLGRGDLQALLQTSKAMAQQVIQLRSGNLELQVKVKPGKNWAATRSLLQWALTARTARTKLRVWSPQDPGWCLADRQHSLEKLSTEAMDNLFGTCTVRSAPLLQQFTSLTHIHLEGFVMPWLVPPGLPDTCPNVHTLALTCCRITGSNSSSSSNANGKSNRNSKGGSAESVSKAVCPSIMHLRLHDTQLDTLLLITGRDTRLQQQQHHFAGQLKAALPGVVCLDVSCTSFHPRLVTLWGPQLSELHVQEYTGRLCPEYSTVMGHLQHLSTLRLIGFTVNHTDDLKALLALPRLECLQLNGIHNVTEDLSSHPCTWQRLQLQLRDSGLSPLDLACVPLHSLQSPLVLGTPEGQAATSLKVLLPDPSMQSLVRLQHLSHQLLQCGLKVLAQDVAYDFPYSIKQNGALDTMDIACAAMLSAIGCVFDITEYIRLDMCPEVGQQVIQALGTAHRCRLKRLELRECRTELQDGAVWKTLLSSLPALEKMELVNCETTLWPHDELDVTTLCSNLVAAMAQQPAGRRMEVCIHRYYGPDKVQSILEFSTATVAIAARYAHGNEACDFPPTAHGWQTEPITVTAVRRAAD